MKAWKGAPLALGVTMGLLLLGLLTLLLPKRDFSVMENRTLAVFGWGTGDFNRQAESWTADHLPLREESVRLWTTLEAMAGRRLQNGALIGRDGWLFEEPPREITPAARTSLAALEELRAEHPGTAFDLMLIPTSAAAAEDRLPPLYRPGDQGAVLAALRDQTSLNWIDPGLAEAEHPERFYYRTDHHLSGAGARWVYGRLCAAWGLTPAAERMTAVPGFQGTYWSKAPVLTIAPEEMTAEIPEGIRLTVDGKARETYLNPERLGGPNKYAALIDSVYGRAVLENPAGEGTLLILGDSYMNALAPLLIRHYARIDLVDPRYFPGSFAAALAESGAERVLVYMGLNTFSETRSLALLPEDDGE